MLYIFPFITYSITLENNINIYFTNVIFEQKNKEIGRNRIN